MTGEQMTLVLGLVVFGLMVLLLSRARGKPAETVPHVKPKHAKPAKKRKR